ncbi:MAG: ATP-dependent RecD-like DNA helicase [Planctomycetota bacterium]|nr:ATP-dependent RecD-like DNA helicase [Planctomycetota bacterium]
MQRGSEPPAGAVLQGTVERVTYHDPESHYTVLKIRPERGYGDPEAVFATERVSAVGTVPAPTEGLRVRLTGRWNTHKTHGRQLELDLFEVLPPLGAEGLVRYLSSRVFQGVGQVLARRIVDKLGPGALGILRGNPAQLEGIPGLRAKVRDDLVATVRRELGAQETYAFLFGTGLGPYQAEAVIRRLGSEAERKVRSDPYVLSREVAGIGFQTADRIAGELGLAPDAIERRCAALIHSLDRASGDGHSLLAKERLFAAAVETLAGDAESDAFEPALEELARERSVVVEGESVYLPKHHASESGLASNLRALVAAGPVRPLAKAQALERVERRAELELDPLQREAVLGLLRAPVALLTGGPGVGKTTIVRLVVELAERAKVRVALASPTGRAAKRLSEATGRPASTIHRLLGFQPVGGRFAHDAHTPLEAGLVIVDEVSMLDVILAHHLVKAIQPPTRLVLVGDPDQLPSVAAGNVLADLIAGGSMPVHRLTTIFRQEAHGQIVRAANRILTGKFPEFARRDDPRGDFFFFGAEDPDEAAERLVEVVTERIPERFGLDWVEDVQVLAPMYRGACGVDALNNRLRAALGHDGREIRWRGRTWRTGDRVIHTRNDYKKEIFNGDMGRIASVEPDGSALVVRYPERRVSYEKSEFADLQPAFAITVHRAQGGEFPAVVMPLITSHHVMLQRHLLYTAVTRAQRLVVLVGSRRALRTALDNADQKERFSGLAERLRAAEPG